MIMQCKKCGQWIKVDEKGIISRARNGFENVQNNCIKTGEDIGRKILGNTGEYIGGVVGEVAAAGTALPYLGGIINAITGSKYNFICPTCGYEWETDNPNDDQTEYYSKIIKLNESVLELVKSTPSIIGTSTEDKNAHIKKLHSLLSQKDINKDLKGILYDALAYSHLNFKNNKNEAIASIEKSLSINPNSPTSLAIRGMILGLPNKPIDAYVAMQSLINYRDINEEEEVTHFTVSQFSDRFEELSNFYVNNFLDIPINSRKYLVIDENFKYLPNSFLVLPHGMIPSNILFPSGHPRTQELYVVHPYKPNEYIPYNEVQLSLFQDELREFSWVMECLGAKSVSFHEIQSEETNLEKEKSDNNSIGGEYKGYGAKLSDDKVRNNSEYKKIANKLLEAKEYTITKDTPPYIPQDIVWYQHRPEWHRNCESRKAGRLVKATFELSTSRTSTTSNQEQRKLEADLNFLVAKANGSHEHCEKISLHKEENHSWSINVEFYPLSEYNINYKPNIPEQRFSNKELVSSVEKKKPKYLFFVMLAVILVLLATIIALV